MDSARCKAFVEAVNEGSFTGAAKKLGYTVSGVSQLVAALEADLGVSLLFRTRKGVLPTEDGKRMMPAAMELLRNEEHLYQIAAEARGMLTGVVKIATFTSAATIYLPELIRDFSELYPGVEIVMQESDKRFIAEALRERTTDIAFCSKLTDHDYYWKPIYEDDMIAVLPRDHKYAKAKVYPIKEVENENFIMPGRGSDMDVKDMMDQMNVHINIGMTTFENFSTLSMIESGIGMSIMNEAITRFWKCNVVKLPVDPPQRVQMGLIVPSLREATPAVRKFLEFAEERLGIRE